CTRREVDFVEAHDALRSRIDLTTQEIWRRCVGSSDVDVDVDVDVNGDVDGDGDGDGSFRKKRPYPFLPTAHQYGPPSPTLPSRSPAPSIIAAISGLVNLRSNRVPNRSSASVRIV